MLKWGSKKMQALAVITVFNAVITMTFGDNAVDNIARDPSIPLNLGDSASHAKPAQDANKKYHVSYIYIAKDTRFAIIDNQLYKEGERIGKYHIANIHAHEVVMRSADKTTILSLYPVNKKDFSIQGFQ